MCPKTTCKRAPPCVLGIEDEDIYTIRNTSQCNRLSACTTDIPWCCGHVTYPRNNSSASPTSCVAGCTDFRSTKRGDGQGRGQIAASLTGSPYFQARHGPDGDDSQAEHEDVQTNRRKQHLKCCTSVTSHRTHPTWQSMSGGRQEFGDQRATISTHDSGEIIRRSLGGQATKNSLRGTVFVRRETFTHHRSHHRIDRGYPRRCKTMQRLRSPTKLQTLSVYNHSKRPRHG